MNTKVEALVDDTAKPFAYANVFARERTSGPERLRIGAAEAQHRCVLLLARTLAGPYKLLYVLHTTRTGAPLGRYEGPEMDGQQIEEFFHRFGCFLDEDARHDLWLHSHDDNATIVLDRHNFIYADGPKVARGNTKETKNLWSVLGGFGHWLPTKEDAVNVQKKLEAAYPRAALTRAIAAEPEGPGPRPTDAQLEDLLVRPESLVEYKGMWMGQGTRDWLKNRWKVVGRGFDFWSDTQDEAVNKTLEYEKRVADDKEYFERQKKAMEHALAKEGRITEKEAVAALGTRLFGIKQGADIVRSVAGIPLSKAKEVMASLSFARVTKNGVTLWHGDVILKRAKELWMLNKERAARGERPLGAKRPVQAGSLFGEGGKPAFELTPSEATTEERIAMAKQRGEAVTPAVERKRAVIPEGEIKAATGGPQRALFAEMEKQASLFKEAAALYSFKPMDAGMIVENAEADTRPPATWADGWSDPGPRDIAFEPVAEGQLDLLKWTEIEASLGVEPEKAKAEEKPAYRAQTVKVQTTGNIKAQSLHIKTDSDVASLLASLRKKPQEELIQVLTDENDTLIEIFRHTKGIIGGAIMHAPDLVGRAVNAGAKTVWLVHNHPSERAEFSPEDASFLTSVGAYIEGAGMKARGLVVAGKQFISWGAGNLYPKPMPIRPVLRKLSFPITERTKMHIRARHFPVTQFNLESIIATWRAGMRAFSWRIDS